MTASANQQPACKSHDSQHQPQECCHPQNLDSANQSNMAVLWPSLLVDLFCIYSPRRRGSISESRSTYTGTLFAVLVVCLLNFSAVGASKHDSNDVITWLETYPVSPVTDATVKSNVPVSVLWGVPDLTVVVGRLLQFTIPPDAFKGDIAKYKVSTAGGGRLPSWVQWVGDDRTLICTPTESDVGLLYITVTAIGKPTNTTDPPSQASDVFSINVVPETAPESTAAPTLVSYFGNVENSVICLPGEPFTMVTVIIDADPGKMFPKDKLKLLSGMKAHMKVPLEFLKLLPMGNKRLLDASAFMAGPGNVKEAKTEGMLLSWNVGCGSDTSNLRGVNRVEETAKSGEMARDLGHDVIGWHVTSPKPHLSKRMKRQLRLRPTPTPVPTVPVLPEQPESSAIPPTRVIPSQASPIFTDVGRTTTLEPTPAPSAAVPADTRVSLTASPRGTRTKPTMSASIMQTPTMLPPRPTRIDLTTSTVVPSRTQLITPTPTFTTAVTPTRVTPPVVTPERTTKEPEPETTTPKKETTPPKVTPPKTPQVPTEPNTPPELINHIDRVTVYQGEVLRFKIPMDTFFDVEDGNTRNLKLVFMNIDGMIMPKNSWVRFNDTTQELYGLPMAENVGTGEYLMAALDSAGAVARDAFEIQVLPREKEFNHKFSVRIDYDFDKFKYDVNKQLLLMQKLAKLYGDSDTSSITVQEFKAGSVIYSWSNNTLPYYPCPSEEITELRSKLMKGGEINPELVEALKPEFIVTKVSVLPAGPCDKAYGTDTPEGPFIDETGGSRATSDDDKWLLIVVPAVVCAAILLLLGLIIFLLYRHRRKGKMTKADKHIFNKGIPIIFADELEDTKPTSSSTPVIMKDEKPPLPPPEYPKVPLPDMPPGVDPHTPDDEFSTPPYQPPPPFSTPQGSRGTRPVIAPPYRSPPPYVPP